MKKGISLITLVITIVVVIVLAAAVILALSGNNPIDSARVANAVQTKDGIESAILSYVSKVKAATNARYETEDILLGKKYGEGMEDMSKYIVVEKSGENYTAAKIIKNDNEVDIYKLDRDLFKEKLNESLPASPASNSAWYVDSNGKVYLYFDEDVKLPGWINDKNKETLDSFMVLPTGARKVASHVNDYYGKTVTNYSANGVSGWKIFHSDGNNIYLITSDYIDVAKIPKTKGGSTLANTNSNYPKAAPLTPALNDTNYSGGAASISTANPFRSWLSYLDTQSSTNNNMKAVAYLMDTSVWNVFVDSTYADYAIGGPTLDLFAASYNKTHPNKTIDIHVKDANGYEFKWASSDTYVTNYITGLGTTSTEPMYVWGAGEGGGSAASMWLASPSARGATYLMDMAYGGRLHGDYYYSTNRGFRPAVRLKSGVQVTKNDDGTVTLN